MVYHKRDLYNYFTPCHETILLNCPHLNSKLTFFVSKGKGKLGWAVNEVPHQSIAQNLLLE